MNLRTAVSLLPTAVAMDSLGARNSTARRRPDSTGAPGRHAAGCDVEDVRPARRRLGVYEPAVRRWEALTRPAPDPLDEWGRLNHWFVEWMMGFPEGWVCGHVKRKDALRLLGNAVVSQQAVLALSLLLSDG